LTQWLKSENIRSLLYIRGGHEANQEELMLKHISLTAAIVTLGIVGSLNAQQTTPPAPAIKRTPLQKVEVPGSNFEVVLGMADFIADTRAGRHSHPGAVLAYVMDGEFILMLDGQPQKAYQAGESFQVPSGAIHNEGTGGRTAKVMAVYVVEKGKPLVQPAQ
jgi:quercetin dioxygenase-like cupin family protein